MIKRANINIAERKIEEFRKCNDEQKKSVKRVIEDG